MPVNCLCRHTSFEDVLLFTSCVFGTNVALRFGPFCFSSTPWAKKPLWAEQGIPRLGSPSPLGQARDIPAACSPPHGPWYLGNARREFSADKHPPLHLQQLQFAKTGRRSTKLIWCGRVIKTTQCKTVRGSTAQPRTEFGVARPQGLWQYCRWPAWQADWRTAAAGQGSGRQRRWWWCVRTTETGQSERCAQQVELWLNEK